MREGLSHRILIYFYKNKPNNNNKKESTTRVVNRRLLLIGDITIIIMNHHPNNHTDTVCDTTGSTTAAAWEEWMSQCPCRIATPQDTVYSQECVYTFHTPYTTKQGILVHCNTFIGTIESMAMQQQHPLNRHNNNAGDETEVAIFVRIVKDYVAKEETSTTTTALEDNINNNNDPIHPMVIPTQLGIGIPGGFPTAEDRYETTTRYSIVVQVQPSEGPNQRWEFPYTIDESISSSSSSIPSVIQQSVNSIIHHVGAAIQTDVQAWSADQHDVIPISKYCETIPYVDNGITIDPNPSSWKCQSNTSSKGDADTNVWLNLSDGYMGGGRKHWDVRIYIYICVCVYDVLLCA